MPKTNSQRVQEHVKKLRKKARAFDALIVQLSTVASLEPSVRSSVVQELVLRARHAAETAE